MCPVQYLCILSLGCIQILDLVVADLFIYTFSLQYVLLYLAMLFTLQVFLHKDTSVLDKDFQKEIISHVGLGDIENSVLQLLQQGHHDYCCDIALNYNKQRTASLNTCGIRYFSSMWYETSLWHESVGFNSNCWYKFNHYAIPKVQGEGVQRIWMNPLSNQELIIASYLGSLNIKPFQV